MKRILVIDDERLLRAPVASVLRRAGYEVESAGSGEEALQLLESARPELILLDLMMPGMGGLGFLRRLRAEPKWAAVPVIVLSAGSDGEQGTEAFKLGARACLLKGTVSLAKLTHFIDVLAGAAA